MATNWGESASTGFFVIDINNNDTSSRFQVFHNADPDPPTTPPADSKCLFTIKEGTTDGVGRLLLGDYSSPAFEIDWGARTVDLNASGDWVVAVEDGDLAITTLDGAIVVGGTGFVGLAAFGGGSDKPVLRLNEDDLTVGPILAPALKIDWADRTMELQNGAWEIRQTEESEELKLVSPGSLGMINLESHAVNMETKALTLNRPPNDTTTLLVNGVGQFDFAVRLNRDTTGASPIPAYINIFDEDGESWHIWVNTSGVLQVTADPPT